MECFVERNLDMLVLTRDENQSIDIDVGDVTIRVTFFDFRNKGKRIRIGVEAPKEFNIARSELRSRSKESGDRA